MASFPVPGDPTATIGDKSLVMYVRPSSSLHFTIIRDRIRATGGKLAAATPWSIRLWARDPRVYVTPIKVWDLSGGPWTNQAGSAVNRGDYETPLNILLVKAAAPGAGKTVRIFNGFGIDMTITLLNQANMIYRWYGDNRVLMTQDSSAGPNSPETLRMDLVTFATQKRKPMVPALINPPSKPFTSTFTYTTTVALDTGSRLFWSEAFA